MSELGTEELLAELAHRTERVRVLREDHARLERRAEELDARITGLATRIAELEACRAARGAPPPPAPRPPHDRIRKLAEAYLTDGVTARMAPEERLRVAVARDGDLDALCTLIGQQSDRSLPEVVVDGDRWYADHVGFRDPAFGYPDDWYDVTERAAAILAKLTATGLAWGRDAAGARALVVTARSRRAELAELSAEALRVSVGDLTGVTSAESSGSGTVVRTDFAVDRLLAVVAGTGERRIVRAEVSALGGTGSAPLRTDRPVAAPRLVARRGVRWHLVTPTTNHKGQVIVAITPVTPGRFLARLRRIWPSGGK